MSHCKLVIGGALLYSLETMQRIISSETITLLIYCSSGVTRENACTSEVTNICALPSKIDLADTLVSKQTCAILWRLRLFEVKRLRITEPDAVMALLPLVYVTI